MATNELTTRILLRTDTSARWESINPVLLKGEFGIVLDGEATSAKIKVGDGKTAWNALPYTVDVDTLATALSTHATLVDKMESVAEDAVNDGLSKIGGAVYQVTKLDEISGTPKKGDIAIVSETIAEDKVQLTAYVYDAENQQWVAMDGNYSASNVYFKDDLVFTKAVGTVTIPASGSTTIEAAGRSVQDVLAEIFAQEDSANLRKTNPSLSVTTGNTYVEIGSTVSPAYATSFADGEYRFGPEPTGVTVVEGSYEVTNNKTTEKILTASGTFADYTFSDVSTYQVTAICDTTAGSNPKSNIGKEYSAQAFAAQTNMSSGAKTLFTSYKPNFYGYTTSANKLAKIDATTLTSDFIRGLLVNQKETTDPVTSYEIKEGWYQFFYAMPLGRKTTLTAKDANNITCTVGKVANVTVKHEGTAESTDYVVFYIDNAAQYGATTIQMTWA